ncbi:hypothetical protein QYM36_002483 [Artemia franciscana]|uniref:Methyltransferase FkbM domain-containing protein n=1 Tax=Artemia franciscana TaxID=6661 RepID=A0AA88I7V6_ARTSF|nr:hypothetical protein QYM36_002483 [Artemia franciscana]
MISIIDLINDASISMNDQYVLECIRNGFLNAKSNDAYNLNAPNKKNPSMGQAQLLIKLLKNKTNGFFVECGALDGETRSNTLYMERFLVGKVSLLKLILLITESWRQKIGKLGRYLPALALNPIPVTFEMRRNQGRIAKNQGNRSVKRGEVQVQCFPLYSILLALNQTVVDYFSLDVEGAELGVLRTIPFDKIDIKTLSVEFIHSAEGKAAIREHMEDRGYKMVQEITHPDWLANDFIFVKESLLV